MSQRYIGGQMVEVPDPNTQAVIRTLNDQQATGEVNAAQVATLDDLRRFLDALHALWRDDPEVGHTWDDDIRERVLQMCAAGHPDAADLAREVLVTSTWDDIPRWSA